MRTTAEVLDRELEAFREERPDYVITDSVAPWGQWAAEILGVPVVTSISTFAINRRVLAFAVTHGVRPKSAARFVSKMRHVVKALRLGRQLRHRHNVKGPGMAGLVFGRSELNIVYTSRHFQPCAESFDRTYEFVGPTLADRGDSADFPCERLRHPTVVFVSLGTLFNTSAGFYRSCFEAFRGRDLQVVLSTGGPYRPRAWAGRRKTSSCKHTCRDWTSSGAPEASFHTAA